MTKLVKIIPGTCENSINNARIRNLAYSASKVRMGKGKKAGARQQPLAVGQAWWEAFRALRRDYRLKDCISNIVENIGNAPTISRQLCA